MVRRRTLIGHILAGRSDASIRFQDLRNLLIQLGFQERIRGSHHIFIFVRQGVEELINLQRQGPEAKPYQVRQVRAILKRHEIGGEF